MTGGPQRACRHCRGLRGLRRVSAAAQYGRGHPVHNGRRQGAELSGPLRRDGSRVPRGVTAPVRQRRRTGIQQCINKGAVVIADCIADGGVEFFVPQRVFQAKLRRVNAIGLRAIGQRDRLWRYVPATVFGDCLHPAPVPLPVFPMFLHSDNLVAWTPAPSVW